MPEKHWIIGVLVTAYVGANALVQRFLFNRVKNRMTVDDYEKWQKSSPIAVKVEALTKTVDQMRVEFGRRFDRIENRMDKHFDKRS